MKRNKGELFAMMALAAAMSDHDNYGKFKQDKPKKKPKKKIIRKGLKEFTYGENSLHALNKKNADRKAKNKGWIK